MHRPHPDVHTHGLADDCEDCAAHAENPIRELDQAMLTMMLTLATEKPRQIPQGHNQAVAVANVLNALEAAGKLAETAPELFVAYLGRWGLQLEITHDAGAAFRDRL